MQPKVSLSGVDTTPIWEGYAERKLVLPQSYLLAPVVRLGVSHTPGMPAYLGEGSASGPPFC